MRFYLFKNKSYVTLDNKSRRAIIKTGLIILLPFLTARPEPTQLPTTEQIAQSTPSSINTDLCVKKVANAAILEDRFTTFAFPEAVVISK